MTGVKDQAQCGACWFVLLLPTRGSGRGIGSRAFAAVECVETMQSIQHGRKPPDLSVQELIDCAAGQVGCDGGDILRTVDWLIQVHPPSSSLSQSHFARLEDRVPVVKDSQYPLTLRDDLCHLTFPFPSFPWSL